MLCSRARRSAEWSPTARFRAQNVRLVTIPCVAGLSHTVDQALDALVLGAERVLAQDGALRLVVELEVHPVDGEVAPALLGLADELPAQPGPGGLRGHRLGLEDLEVAGHPRHQAALLEVERLFDDRRADPPPVDEVAGLAEVFLLDLQGAGLAAVGEADLAAP